MVSKKRSHDGSKYITDEKFNTASHLIGLILSLVIATLLIVYSILSKDIYKIISFVVYGASLIFLFTASTLHHGLELKPKGTKVFRILDYNAIFFLIAGSFTPMCLVVIKNIYGYSILGVIWFLAIAGITLKSIFDMIPKWATNTVYVGMGWVALFLVVPLFQSLSIWALILLFLGGIFYTLGSFIFYMEKPNLIPGKFGFHEIWHLFVLLGAFFHVLLMWFYILPF